MAKPVSSDTGLRFSFAEMRREIDNMAAIARPFLEPAAYEQIIPAWVQELWNFATSPHGSKRRWQIPMSTPIQTIRSAGEYDTDDSGEHTVFGTLSAIWDIKTPLAGARTKKKHTAHTSFLLVGCASTRVAIFEYNANGNHRELARWRFEVGDARSPGCHFHVQVMGEEKDEFFPKSMCVPRLPGILLTPMDSLEFLLAEIFQARWRQHAARQTDWLRNWAACQRKRLMNLFDWHRAIVAGTAGSPWTTLKAEKPEVDLLIAEGRH
jgi:hypothetical protein